MKRNKLKKRRNRLRLRRKLVLTSTLVLFLVIGIGYSALSVNLNIFGNITVKKHYGNTLYEVLEKEASIGTYAKEYTGEHHDSFTEEPRKKIYHWYAPDTSAGDTLATEIKDKNNVIFANHCWQMIRTTDTGGVKMVYNGEVENNQCMNTRGKHVGYSTNSLSGTYRSLSDNYYYGTSYNYDKTNNVFSLSGTITTGSIQTRQYTCLSTSSTGTCATLYLVDSLREDGLYYYVLPLDGNSNYYQLGTLEIKNSYKSPAYVGYMYNTVYLYNDKLKHIYEYIYTNSPLSTSYYYADSYSLVGNRYKLTNPYQVSSSNDYGSLVGKYTLKDSSANSSSTELYYIAGVSGSTMYYILIEDGHDLNYFNNTYTYGDSYVDNGNGTYTINNPSSIVAVDWFTNYSNVESGNYVCKNATNNTCNELWYVSSSANRSLAYIKVEDNCIYANGFTYDNNTNTYTLSNDRVEFWNGEDSSNNSQLTNHHYTCFNDTGVCETISYIYLSSSQLFYINLNNGKGVEDALEEMFHSDNVNTYNSSIKTGIDFWYKMYLYDYTSYLEDTIYCNDRNISQLGGWNPNGGYLLGTSSNYLEFKNFWSNNDLSCSRITDKFSINNSKARLTYPVGLLSLPEVSLLNNFEIVKTGSSQWLISPSHFFGAHADGNYISYNGVYNNDMVSNPFGVRPAISLKPGVEYKSGDGSMENPYIVDINP